MQNRPPDASAPHPLSDCVSHPDLDSAIEEFRILETCLAQILQSAVRPRCAEARDLPLEPVEGEE